MHKWVMYKSQKKGGNILCQFALLPKCHFHYTYQIVLTKLSLTKLSIDILVSDNLVSKQFLPLPNCHLPNCPYQNVTYQNVAYQNVTYQIYLTKNPPVITPKFKRTRSVPFDLIKLINYNTQVTWRPRNAQQLSQLVKNIRIMDCTP